MTYYVNNNFLKTFIAYTVVMLPPAENFDNFCALEYLIRSDVMDIIKQMTKSKLFGLLDSN